MRSPTRYPCLLAPLLLLGCCTDDAAHDDTPPPDAASDTTDPDQAECTRAIDRAAIECPPLSTLTVIELDAGQDRPPLDIIDLASVSMTVPGGLYVPSDPSFAGRSTLGHVLADNGACQVSCTLACDISTNDLCLSTDSDRPSCSFCGTPASPEACEAFVAACE
jgi:hypothetical protein